MESLSYYHSVTAICLSADDGCIELSFCKKTLGYGVVEYAFCGMEI